MHAHFLEDCLAENVIPTGLRLKVKVNTGCDSSELQKSSVSSEISEQIRDEHLRKSEKYGADIEEVRSELKKV